MRRCVGVVLFVGVCVVGVHAYTAETVKDARGWDVQRMYGYTLGAFEMFYACKSMWLDMGITWMDSTMFKMVEKMYENVKKNNNNWMQYAKAMLAKIKGLSTLHDNDLLLRWVFYGKL